MQRSNYISILVPLRIALTVITIKKTSNTFSGLSFSDFQVLSYPTQFLSSPTKKWLVMLSRKHMTLFELKVFARKTYNNTEMLMKAKSQKDSIIVSLRLSVI